MHDLAALFSLPLSRHPYLIALSSPPIHTKTLPPPTHTQRQPSRFTALKNRKKRKNVAQRSVARSGNSRSILHGHVALAAFFVCYFSFAHPVRGPIGLFGGVLGGYGHHIQEDTSIGTHVGQAVAISTGFLPFPLLQIHLPPFPVLRLSFLPFPLRQLSFLPCPLLQI